MRLDKAHVHSGCPFHGTVKCLGTRPCSSFFRENQVVGAMDDVKESPGAAPTMMVDLGAGLGRSKDVEAITSGSSAPRSPIRGSGDGVQAPEQLPLAGGSGKADNDLSQISLGTSQDHSSQDSESETSHSKAIVFFQKEKRGCHPHKFDSSTKTKNMLGVGSYGEVFKVGCTSCRKARDLHSSRLTA